MGTRVVAESGWIRVCAAAVMTITVPTTSSAMRETLLPLLATRAYRHGAFTLSLIHI